MAFSKDMSPRGNKHSVAFSKGMFVRGRNIGRLLVKVCFFSVLVILFKFVGTMAILSAQIASYRVTYNVYLSPFLIIFLYPLLFLCPREFKALAFAWPFFFCSFLFSWDNKLFHYYEKKIWICAR